MNEPTRDEAEPRKGLRTILEQEISAGLSELQRPSGSLFLSSLTAGLDLGFSVLLLGVVYTHFSGDFSPALVRISAAAAYSIGFILVILGRSELFTEHTALAVLPVLDGRSTVKALAKTWAVVFLGNIVGAIAFALVLQWAGPALGAVEPAAFEHVAKQMTDHPAGVIIVSGILAGWLMGELGWLVAASRDTISQIVSVFIITTAIGFAHLHHVVVGSAEVAVGFLTGATDVGDLFRFLALAGLGNALGGVIFVAILKYGHAKQSR